MIWLFIVAGGLLIALRLRGNKQFRPRRAVPGPKFDISYDTSRFDMLGNASEAFGARLNCMRNARHSVDCQYYSLADDSTGRRFIAELLQTCQRGVAVRLLLDDIAIGTHAALLAALAENYTTLQVRIFNPLYLRRWQVIEHIARFPLVNRRMHNKSLTADRDTSILGGRNIADAYFAKGKRPWFADHDVLVRGKVAGSVADQFDIYWECAWAWDVADVMRADNGPRYIEWHSSVVQMLSSARFEAQASNDDLRELAFGKVLYDTPEKIDSPLFEQNDRGLASQLESLLDSAKETVMFSSPYLIPGDAGMAIIERLRERGVEVTALTNSFASNDVWLVNSGYLDYRKRLLKAGVRIFELKPARAHDPKHAHEGGQISLHAKAFVLDGSKVFNGSLNFDSRSALHNTELGVVFEDEECGESVMQWIEEKLHYAAYEVFFDDNNKLCWRESLSDSEDRYYHHDPETTWASRLCVYAASWLPVEWML